MPGTFFEVEFRTIYTTPARESDLDVKIVKADGLGTFLEVESAFRVAGVGILT